MKKNYFALAFMAFCSLVFFSCASTSHTVAGTNLNGNYILNNVSFTGIDSGAYRQEQYGKDTATYIHRVLLNTIVFDDVAPDYFRGSNWSLPHNGYGSYTINGDQGIAGTRNIVWSVRTDPNGQKKFQLKILDGRKAKNVTEGYLLDLTNVTPSGFSITQPIIVDNKTATVQFDFVRQ